MLTRQKGLLCIINNIIIKTYRYYMTLEEFDKLTTMEQIDYFENQPITSSRRKTLVYCTGINNVTFKTSTTIEGKTRQHPAYHRWHKILERCYSEKSHRDRPTYKNCIVCEDWKIFSNFNRWFKEQHIEGYQIDKDILFFNNKIYSSDTCIFIPSWINLFVTANDKSRGKYKIGVNFDKASNKFRAKCSVNSKQIMLGLFDNEEEAHVAWLNCKLQQLLTNKEAIDRIDIRLYNALVNKVMNLK